MLCYVIPTIRTIGVSRVIILKAKHLYFYCNFSECPLTLFVLLISGHGLANLTYNADQWETGLEDLLRFAQDV
jgi:hypothetical protein